MSQETRAGLGLNMTVDQQVQALILLDDILIAGDPEEHEEIEALFNELGGRQFLAATLSWERF